MNLQPLEDRIVVRPGVAEETTASGLVIPDTAQEKPPNRVKSLLLVRESDLIKPENSFPSTLTPATPLFTANTVAPKSHRAAKTYSF